MQERASAHHTVQERASGSCTRATLLHARKISYESLHACKIKGLARARALSCTHSCTYIGLGKNSGRQAGRAPSQGKLVSEASSARVEELHAIAANKCLRLCVHERRCLLSCQAVILLRVAGGAKYRKTNVRSTVQKSSPRKRACIGTPTPAVLRSPLVLFATLAGVN